MAVTEIFRKAVEDKDVISVRIMMKDSLLQDPSFSKFREMEMQAKSIPDLYAIHDGTMFNTDKSAWNDDYMNDIKVDLIDNFSHERIAHLKEVIQYLHPYTQEEIKNLSGNNFNINKPTAVGGMAGAGIGGVIATAISTSAGATVACIIGGGVAGAAIGHAVGKQTKK